MNTHPMRWPRRGLYAITPDEPSTARLLARVEPVLLAGAALVQYRNKCVDEGLALEQARALRDLCAHHGIPFIVNDDVALAAAVQADGVHLGSADTLIADARAQLGDGAIIGASCYNDLALARAAVAAGADYVAFGAFYPSGTKPAARRAPLSLLQDTAMLGVPRVAIGGITPANVGPLLQAGADLIAVIGGLFDNSDTGTAARSYISRLEEFSA